MTKENRDAITEEIDVVNNRLASVQRLDCCSYIELCVAEWEGKGHIGTYAELCAEVESVKEQAKENYSNYLKECFFQNRAKIVENSDLRDAFYYNSDLPTLPNGNKVFDAVFGRALGVWLNCEEKNGITSSLVDILERFEKEENSIMEAVKLMGIK